jgi:Tfp pilus assembly protein PilN
MGRLPQRRLAIIIGVAALLLLALSFGQLLVARYEVGQRADSLRAEIAALREENADLQKELQYRQSDQGVEQSAREQLGWTKAEDTLVVVPGTPSAGATDIAARATPRSRPPNWRRWVTLVTGW